MNKLKIGFVSICAILATGCTAIPQTSTPAYRDYEPNIVGKPIAERINESQTAINDQFSLLERIHSGNRVGTYSVVEHNNNLDARKGSDYTLPQEYAHNTFDIPNLPNKQFVAVESNGRMEKINENIQTETIDTNITNVNLDGVGVESYQLKEVKREVIKIGEDSNSIVPVDPSKPVSVALKNTELPKNSVTVQNVKKIDWQNNSLNTLSKNLASALGYELVIKEGTVKDQNVTFTVENKTLLEVIEQLKTETSSIADIVVLDENKTFNIFYK